MKEDDSRIHSIPSIRTGYELMPEIEIYTDERIAEFLLNNAIDAEDYQAARKEVEAMGLNPDDILHEPPQ